MGTVVAVYSESQRTFFQLGAKLTISMEERRRLLGSPMRYCIGGNYIYLPAENPSLPPLAQLCWARIRSESIYEFDFHLAIGAQLPESCTLDVLEEGGIRLADRYVKRQREVDVHLQKVDEFCAESLIELIASDTTQIASLTKTEFEEICAEMFARKGFKVDLFRASKDGGIDFLAVHDTSSDPIVYAVQCKHPDKKTDGRKPKTMGLPVVQQIYGAAKAFDLQGGIAITSTTYSPTAKRFADLKPTEIQVHDGSDVISWITKFRWNEDER